MKGGQKAEGNNSHVRAQHVDLAVGEVDQLDDPIDHGVAQGDQGIHAAERQAVNQLLDEHISPKKKELYRVSCG